MKIVCISDTHCIAHPEDLPEGDVLIHAGDLSMGGEIHEIQHALDWLRKFPHKYKLVIGGNHDNALAELPYAFEEQFKPYKGSTGLVYLHGTEVRIEGLKFFGSSVIPHCDVFRAGARAYMLDATTSRHWGYAPDCDILVTHGPPKGVLDMGYGDPQLAAYVKQTKPKLHVFGHVHLGHGVVTSKDTIFVNASLVNERYEFTNKPTVIEV